MARMRKSLMTLYRDMLPLVQSLSIAQENTRYSEILDKKEHNSYTQNNLQICPTQVSYLLHMCSITE